MKVVYQSSRCNLKGGATNTAVAKVACSMVVCSVLLLPLATVAVEAEPAPLQNTENSLQAASADFVESENPAAEAVASETASETTSEAGETVIPIDSASQRAVEYYASEVKRLEIEGDSFDALLAENLFGLAKAYRDQGKYGDALTLFRQSLHIDRVNNGLYNLSQEALHREIIHTYSKMGDWESSRNSLEAIHRINLKTYGENDPRMIPVLTELAEWHLNVYAERDDGQIHHLVDAHDFSQHAIRLIRAHVGESDLRLVKQHRASALAYYYLSAHLSQQDDFSQTVSESVSRDQERRIQAFLVGGIYRKGRENYQQVVNVLSRHADVPDIEKAQAYAELGDWFLLFGKRQAALEAYQGSLSFVESDDEKQQLWQAIFQPVTILPATSFGQQIFPRKEAEGSVVEVNMTLTKYGLVESLQVLKVMGNAVANVFKDEREQELLNRKTRRILRGVRFRPLIENNQFAERENAQASFRVEI